jgi:hypothetical protein
MYGCHRDDNRYNNHLDNLYWGTPWQNKQDAKRNGRTNKGKNYNVGENHPRAKLTPKQVKQIRIKYDKNDCSIRSLARKFGISHSTVLDIVKGRSWTLPK